MFGEPKPKYIVFQYFANEGAKILAQLTHEADVHQHVFADGMKAMLQQCPDLPRLPAGVAVRREQRPGPDRHHLQHRQGAVRQQGRALGAAAGDRHRRLHGPGRGRRGRTQPGAHPVAVQLPQGLHPADACRGWKSSRSTSATAKPSSRSIRTPRSASSNTPSARGYEVPTDPAEQAKLFGYGWYKYAPDVAEKLLVKNGFSKNADGKWLLPDGTPWKIRCLSEHECCHRHGRPQLHGRGTAVEEVRHRRRDLSVGERRQPQLHRRLRRVR